jgi:hypothetical protein
MTHSNVPSAPSRAVLIAPAGIDRPPYSWEPSGPGAGLVIDSSVRLPWTLPRRAATLLDPDKMPPVYKMRADGVCLIPLIRHGAWLAFDRSGTPDPFVIVVVFLTPEAMGTYWGHQAIVKRMVQPFPPGTRLGAQAARAGQTPAPEMIVEQINPFRQYAFRPDQVLGDHCCVGITTLEPADKMADDEEFALAGGRRHG